MNSEWDLSVLCNGFDDPKINDSINFANTRASEIEKEYKGKIIDLSEEELAKLLVSIEEIYIRLSEVNQFASLSVSSDSNNIDALKLQNRVHMVGTQLSQKLTFFDLELAKLLSIKPEYINHPKLSDRKYYLQKTLDEVSYLLSENEEKIILEKNLYGIQEWSKLQSHWLSKKKFFIEVEDEIQEHSWATGISLITHKDRKVRREAVNKLFNGLKEDEDLYAFALRNVCANSITEFKRRGYPNYMQSSLMRSNLEKEMLDAMFEVVEENVAMFHEYLSIKAKLLGTDKLLGEDFYAPLPFADTRKISWEDACKMIIDGYSDFDSEFGEIAKDMLNNNRVDSNPRSGKRGGAFCSTWFNGKSAFILQTFNGTINNVKTLAHEMGHAVHAYLASKNNNLSSMSPGMSLAESASEFGTMLFSDKFIREAPDAESKKAILFGQLSSLMQVIFEVSSRTKIEQKLYEALDKGEYLSPDKINELFWEGREVYFGDAIEWRPEQVYEWAFKGHYYISGLRFYNYPYVVGELLVLAFYNQYRVEGDSFIPKFKEYLASGGSKSAAELTAKFGFNLSSKEFWQQGINEIKRMLEEFKSLM